MVHKDMADHIMAYTPWWDCAIIIKYGLFQELYFTISPALQPSAYLLSGLYSASVDGGEVLKEELITT